MDSTWHKSTINLLIRIFGKDNIIFENNECNKDVLVNLKNELMLQSYREKNKKLI
ncbi:hypothetical protein JCM21531_4699 [Acetivibrio straminisolvens JCM 21531]|uniref:Uncharacterized protein n=1 Tax=Acetivibrio straminisolvens JCM 21531 TaxID=1294263 RepID=W4VDZ9_9FIRM|nr:hypothetical protein JCM21531_4699 [Acetivibrio straminisolvens JCM 21531]